MLLKDLLDTGFGDVEDYNCGERLIAGANKAYGLGLDHSTIVTAGAFGGGLHAGEVCGAVCGSCMAIARIVIKKCAHESDILAPMVREFMADYARKMGALNCSQVREMYYTEELHCIVPQKAAAEVLDQFLIKKGLLDPVTGELIKK